MLPPPQLVAYPLLLAAVYAIYRVGRGARRRSARFEWTRLGTLAALFGLILALQVRFVEAGYVRTPLGMVGAVLAVSGVFGLLGINMMDALEASRSERRAPRAYDA